VASARAWLREANAERWHLFFPDEFDMCSENKISGDSDLGLCQTTGLAKIMPLCSADF